MNLRLFLVLLSLSPLACASPSEPDNPVVDLVSAADLTTVFPAAVDSFAFVSDTTYLGYKELEGDTLALITVARMYQTPTGQMLAINLSSFDDRRGFLNTYSALVRDTSETHRETYDVTLGRLVLPDDYHAAEAKSFDSPAIRAALNLIDYDLLASLETEPIEVDSMFVVRRD